MNRSKSLKLIVTVVLILGIVLGISLWSKAAEGDLISITFNDRNLYNSILEELGNKIESHDNTTTTIGIRENVLSEVTNLDLNSREISNINGIEYFTNLTSLNLSGNSGIQSIDKLSNLKNLTTLNLSGNKAITDISPINSLTNIKDLNLSNIPIGSLSSINKLVNLKKLNISNTNMTNDYTIKYNFTKLEELNISNNITFTNFDCIVLNSLKVLNVSSTAITEIADPSDSSKVVGIKTMRNLEELDLSGCKNVQDLDAIYSSESIEVEPYEVAYLNNLKKLKLNNLDLYGLGNAQILTNLTNIELSNNKFSYVDQQLTYLENLEYIDLSYNELQDANGLVREEYNDDGNPVYVTTNATTIKLQHNQIGSHVDDTSGIDCFAYFNNLKELDLSYNQITYIEDIYKFITNSSSTTVYLDHQDANWSIYGKETKQDQYIILPSIMQYSKINTLKTYTTQEFTEDNLTLNRDSRYLKNPYYNVIIKGDKDIEDRMSLTINGGIADGSTLHFQMNPSDTSGIDSIMFEDDNLAKQITAEFQKKAAKDEIQYIIYAPMLINTLNADIKTITELDLSNKDNVDSNKIKNLSGMSNFTELTSLNLSNNLISNQSVSKISELDTLRNLNILYLNRNQISDYNFIREMYNLKILDLSDNNITSTDTLAQFIEDSITNFGDTYMESLNMSNNTLKNSAIQVIKQLTNLKTLGISNTGINNISELKDLIALENIYIDSDGIKDISVLSKFKNLKNVSMSNNDITNIDSLRGLSIISLNMSKNKISNISALTGMTSLTSLDMSQNRIEDVSGIINRLTMDTPSFNMKNQRITRQIQDGETGIIQIELPQVFKDAKKSSSKYIYTAQDLVLSDCTLSSDGNYVEVNIDELGTKVATVTIKGAQADGTRLAIGRPVNATITYNVTEKTKGPVVATITFDKSNVTVTNNDGNTSYTFNQNGSFEFEYQDEYGFIGTKTATVDWIDNLAPILSVEYSEQNKTNQNVTVQIKANEEIQPVAGWELLQDKMTLSKTYSSNTQEEVTVKDLVGNETKENISVQNIDKKSPVITGITNGATVDKNVLPVIQDESNVTITLTKDGSIIAYNNGDYITENGSYELRVEDEAGNVTVVTFTIEKTETKDDTVTSNTYNVDNNKIMRVKPETRVIDFKDNIYCESSYVVKDVNGNTMSDNSYIGTRCKVITETGREYTVVVLADSDGNGKIDLVDVGKAPKIYLGTVQADEIDRLVYDLDGNGKVDLVEVGKLPKIYLKILNL